jgi:hypothetical protein
LSLAQKLNKLYSKLSSTKQAELVASYVKKDADALSERNSQILSLEKRQSVIESRLDNHNRDMDTIRFVEARAKKMGVAVDDSFDDLPDDFKDMYLAAVAKVKPLLDELKKTENPLDISIMATVFDDTLQLYLPIRWSEKQEVVLPGALYMATMVAAQKTVYDLGEVLPNPVEYRCIVRMDIPGKEPRKSLSSIMQNIYHEGIPEFDKAKVDVKTGLVMLTVDMDYLDRESIVKPTIVRVPEVSQGLQGDYSIAEAAVLWREHEEKIGTVNGTPMNYRLKAGKRAGEGRLRTEKDSSVTKDALEDFVRYNDTRRKYVQIKDSGRKEIPYAEAMEILGIEDAEVFDDYVYSNKLVLVRSGYVSSNSLKTFLKNHNLVDGKWTDFENLRSKRKKSSGNGQTRDDEYDNRTIADSE